MNLDLSQTLELYTSYIQYRSYLSSVLGMSPSLFTFHYPLRCSESSTASVVNHNTGNIGSVNIGNKETISVSYPTPVTPQQAAMCHASNKRKGPHLIYSEEIDHPLKALRYFFITLIRMIPGMVTLSLLSYSTFLYHFVVLTLFLLNSRVHDLLHAGVDISSNSNNNNHIQVLVLCLLLIILFEALHL